MRWVRVPNCKYHSAKLLSTWYYLDCMGSKYWRVPRVTITTRYSTPTDRRTIGTQVLLKDRHPCCTLLDSFQSRFRDINIEALVK